MGDERQTKHKQRICVCSLSTYRERLRLTYHDHIDRLLPGGGVKSLREQRVDKESNECEESKTKQQGCDVWYSFKSASLN